MPRRAKPILLATTLATGVAGLLGGCTGLVVGGAAATGVAVAHDRRTAGVFVEDQSIELKASGALGDDPLLSEQAHINVTSYNQAVLLSGEAPTPELRQRAGQIVRRIRGVKRVYNELELAAPSALASRTSDGLITGKVKAALLGVKGLEGFDPTRVKVVTERGIVYLMGLVSRAEVAAVTERVRRVGGVQKVVQLFDVQPETPAATATATT